MSNPSSSAHDEPAVAVAPAATPRAPVEPTPQVPDQEPERRPLGVLAFVCGAVTVLVTAAFFPSLPHVIDWGAVLTALAVGLLARRTWRTRAAKKRAGREQPTGA
ncbi:hypothetical protein [Streptomyces albireticuli]|uniref:hypothetical protein n=1 Tax=Streptomyces albireticuli TaxID=1940 RepID=UPI001E578CCD|nr:hypothetical protein [Streptomyces albireticuli]MCD9145215.1 hypothetical protein [Streptomyces albireticuli]MCD9164610.1 hypothetical protein [Streptomyces albireticuli]MCD9194875.1 hypothetical protein [Streptomyces albireticuli]